MNKMYMQKYNIKMILHVVQLLQQVMMWRREIPKQLSRVFLNRHV